MRDKLSAARRALSVLREHLSRCRLCPWECGVDRAAGERGRCGLPAGPVVSGYEPHFGEEACLVGKGGSGAVFFTGCNLFCVFCQTWEISREGRGREIGAAELAGIFLELQEQGCENLNLITPTPQIPAILEALVLALEKGFSLPVVYNTGGYERVEVLRELAGVVDIYLPDFKVWDPEVAERILGARDYPERAREAIREMYRQVGNLVCDERGVARRGLLVRHLILPGGLAGTYEIMRFLVKEVSKEVTVNLMGHYHPEGEAHHYPPLDRPLWIREWQKALFEVKKAGIFKIDQTHWKLLGIILLDNSSGR
ncbi:radical SAM protein [Thermosulfurimonas sp. F29]|uniref:radical SAM protein n=1 Tax=Thermosulfurimonas sp. F29 TaxID=2867247 RepID=UPI001C8364CF|nr:radical SAM protein [Thermosulfurimonas sp. F29]MBX6423941.1 radical SAM protein [Thermosulfurimonas sp. F29]